MEGGLLISLAPGRGVVQDGCALLPKVLLAGTHCAPPFLEVVTLFPLALSRVVGTAPLSLLGGGGGRKQRKEWDTLFPFPGHYLL